MLHCHQVVTTRQAFLIIKDVLLKKIYIYIVNLNVCVKPNVTFFPSSSSTASLYEDITMWSLSFQRSTVREKMIFTFHTLSV